MINATIVDDEPTNRSILKDLLKEFCPEVKVINEASNPDEAISAIQEGKPDLVFLDIEMPYGNAFDLLDKLKPVDFEIIFVTAFDEYTLKAFRYSALDYLLKPVDIDELQAAVQKATSKVNLKNINAQLTNLLFNLQKNSDTSSRIAIASPEGLTFVAVNEIVRCEAKGHYTFVFTSNGKKHIASKNIKAFEEMLPTNVFFRIHHSHIINVGFIKKYHRGRGGYLEMKDGATIEVATRRKNEFLAMFGYK